MESKQTISDGQLKNELIKLFESGNTSKAKCSEVLRSSYKLMIQRFYKEYDIAYKEWQQIKEKATNEQIQENAKEMLQSGLKSKIDWILELQKELDENRVEESALDFKTGKVIRYYRTMTPTERKGYIERIAKFQGMDAPSKVAQTDPDGNPVMTSKDIDKLHTIVEELNGKK